MSDRCSQCNKRLPVNEEERKAWWAWGDDEDPELDCPDCHAADVKRGAYGDREPDFTVDPDDPSHPGWLP